MKTDIYEAYLSTPAKTESPLTLFEHSSDVLQVLDFLIAQNSTVVQHHDLIRAGALVHDVGKIAGDISGGRWVHTSHSAQFLDTLLEDSRFRELLALAHIDLSNVDRGLLLKICERHHQQSPGLLVSCKDAVLVGVADALASAIEAGTVGQIEEILRRSPYLQVSIELVYSLGFTVGGEGEVHYLDLPGRSVQDLILADMLFRLVAQELQTAGLTPILQRGSRLCVVGPVQILRGALDAFTFEPQRLYSSFFQESIYDSILAQFPAGSTQIDILRYLLITEPTARRMAVALYTRGNIRKLLERHNLSQLLANASQIFNGGLKDGIDQLWQPVRSRLLELSPDLRLPDQVSIEVENVARSKLKRSQIALFWKPRKEENDKVRGRQDRSTDERASRNQRVLEALTSDDETKEIASDIQEFLKLFDASQNAYRSVTNIFLEWLKVKAEGAAGKYTLRFAEVALLDSAPLKEGSGLDNAAVCPVCRRFPNQLQAPALITGRSEGDSSYYASHGSREGAIHVCPWCFIAGYMDLPLASFTRDGNSVIKNGEYLLIESPLSTAKLQLLVDFVSRGDAGNRKPGDDDEQVSTEIAAQELSEIEAMFGIEAGFDELAVLGASRRRLAHLKGFVLPSVNVFGNFVGVRIPFEALVKEDKVSGAVQGELAKATMYDLRVTTGAVSMHYAVRGEGLFSVSGQPVSIDEMRRANVAYRIANRYARVGRDRQLHSGLFMLLLSSPREATTLMLRGLRRENRGAYAPGEQRIKEVIELTEELAAQDWKFALGQKIVGTLIDVGLTPKDRGFRPDRSGHDLVKWLQRFKMVRDEGSARAWGTMLINALKRGDLAYKDFILQKGGTIAPPGEQKVGKILDLVEEIVSTCAAKKVRLSEFSREVAHTDYYLLFFHNQKAKEEKDGAAKAS